jgi:hypothetical protein
LHGIYPALNEWVTWLLNSQMGPIGTPGGEGLLDTGTKDTSSSFRWRGRTTVDDKLIANTLASGLDDYPRSAIPSLLEYHVDLFSWMAKATAIMSRLEGVLNVYYDRINRQGRHVFDSGYSDKALHIRTRLDALHWSDKHQAYLDVGYSSDLALVVTEMILRCGNKVEKKAMDVAVPNTMIKVSFLCIIFQNLSCLFTQALLAGSACSHSFVTHCLVVNSTHLIIMIKSSMIPAST